MVTIRISDECADILRKLAEGAKRSLCKQVEAMILSQKAKARRAERKAAKARIKELQNDREGYEQAWRDIREGKNLIDTGPYTTFENLLKKLGIEE